MEEGQVSTASIKAKRMHTLSSTDSSPSTNAHFCFPKDMYKNVQGQLFTTVRNGKYRALRLSFSFSEWYAG